MKQRNIFSTINPGSNIWIRNPNHFLKNYDLSGIAVSVDVPTSDYAAHLKSGVLISDKHVLFARHVIGETFNVNQFPKTIKFVNNNNQVFTYTIAYTYYTVINNTDIAIGVLNTKVDSSICFYKIFPSTFDDYYKKIIDPFGAGSEMPVVFIDQNKNLSVGDARFERQNTNPYYNASYIWKIFASYDDSKYQYAEKAITYDSGNAVLAVLNNELVLLGTWWIASNDSRLPINKGDFIGAVNATHKYITQINTLMIAMTDSSYSLSITNSNFKKYSGAKIPSIQIGPKYEKYIRGYNKSPTIQGVTQENSTVSLFDDNYPLGTISPASVLNYSFDTEDAYLGITTNGISGNAYIDGNYSDSSDIIAYTVPSVPSPLVFSRGNTTNQTPKISGTWSQTELTTLNEQMEIDIYDNNIKISNSNDVILNNLNNSLSFYWEFTPSSNLSYGEHAIKAKANSYNLNISNFSNTITFTINNPSEG